MKKDYNQNRGREMLSRRVGTLKITNGHHEGKPLLILEGYCDEVAANSLYEIILQFLNNNAKNIFIDIKKMDHADIKTNMILSKARNEFIKEGGCLTILSHSERVSKAMKIMRKNRYAGSH